MESSRGREGRGGSEESVAEETVKEESTQDDAPQQLSLGEAVGQMFVVGTNGTEPDYYIQKMVHERNIGGVILTGPNIESLEQTQTLISKLQELSMETPSSIPLIIAVDEEGGSVTRAPWISPQPAAAMVGQSGDPDWAYQIA